MIEVTNLTKHYGRQAAVEDLSFTVKPGVVTGFLGPNGAGKSTTMRLILGLDRPTTGRALVNGKPFEKHPAPLREIGVLLDAKGLHPGRPARDHLLALAATTGISKRRVAEVLDLVGLSEVADRRSGGFSLGMGQRLGIASALLGDPHTVMLDEPVNGLDPEGILWIRNLLKSLAAEGRTVFVSSHLMSEMALTAEHFIIVGRRSVQAGASGFLGKGVEPADLLDAIRIVASGEALLSPRATSGLLAQVRLHERALPTIASERFSSLTPRERELTTLVATGLSNDDIAEHLYLSPLTVKTHVNRAMMKLGVRDRAQLVVLAYEGGLIQPGRER